MEEKKKRKKKKNHIPFRLNILFLIIFLAFSALILRLGVVQIVHGEDYERKLEATNKVVTKVESVRGLIRDRNGTLLVGNKAEQAIVFTRKPDQDTQDLLDIAKKLSQYITVSTNKKVPDGALSTEQVTERDKKDFWLALHPDKAKAMLSAKEQNSKKSLQPHARSHHGSGFSDFDDGRSKSRRHLAKIGDRIQSDTDLCENRTNG